MCVPWFLHSLISGHLVWLVCGCCDCGRGDGGWWSLKYKHPWVGWSSSICCFHLLLVLLVSCLQSRLPILGYQHCCFYFLLRFNSIHSYIKVFDAFELISVCSARWHSYFMERWLQTCPPVLGLLWVRCEVGVWKLGLEPHHGMASRAPSRPLLAPQDGELGAVTSP